MSWGVHEVSSGLARGVKVVQTSLDTLGHGDFTSTNPDTRVVVLLVRLVFAVWVADLAL